MKILCVLLCFAVFIPAWAEPAPNIEPVLNIYCADKSENSRRAVRLGYKNFRRRINTPDMTFTDIKIARLITTGFQPFFDKLNNLEPPSDGTPITLTPQLNDEFQNLIIELAKLLLKNQQRYTNSLFLDDEAAAQETVVIVQQAIELGSF